MEEKNTWIMVRKEKLSSKLKNYFRSKFYKIFNKNK